jgi:hypothetical protein
MNRARAVVAAVLSAFAAGCYSHEAAVSRLREDNPPVQVETIAEVVRAGDKAAVGDMIDLLDSKDEGVRFMAAAGLHQLTGRSTRDHLRNEEERKATVAHWHRWWETQQKGTGNGEPGTGMSKSAAP